MALIFAALWWALKTHSPANPPEGLREFEDWTSDAQRAFGPPFLGERSDPVLGSVMCANNQIGDRWDLEPACGSWRPVRVGSKDLEFRADWSAQDRDVWHADVVLETDQDPNCDYLASAKEIGRKRNASGFIVLCKMPNTDEVVMAKTEKQMQIGHLSGAFVRRYPHYMHAVLEDQSE